jgi:hypothetical protein
MLRLSNTSRAQEEERAYGLARMIKASSGTLTRGLLGNAQHEWLRVDEILQVNTSHPIPNEQEVRFIQVRGPR